MAISGYDGRGFAVWKRGPRRYMERCDGSGDILRGGDGVEGAGGGFVAGV